MMNDKFNAEYWDAELRELEESSNRGNFASALHETHVQINTQRTASAQACVEFNWKQRDAIFAIQDLTCCEKLSEQLFHMVDRFHSALEEFADEYDAACKGREDDLRNCYQENENAKKQAKYSFQNKIEALKMQKFCDISAIQRRADANTEEIQDHLRSEKNALKEWQTIEKEKVFSGIPKTYANLEDSIQKKIISPVEWSYKKSYSLVNTKIQRAMEHAKNEKPTLNNIKTILSDAYKEDATEVFYQILKVTRKLFRINLKKRCVALARIYGQMLSAFDALTHTHKTACNAAQAHFQEESTEKEKNLRCLEEEAKNKLASIEQDKDIKVAIIESDYATRMKHEENAYAKQLEEIRNKLEVEESKCQQKWVLDLSQKESSFYDRIEFVFPHEQIKKLFKALNVLSNHINKPFCADASPAYNVVIGNALIPFLSTVTIESQAYDIIHKLVMEKYSCMFAFNSEKDFSKIKIPFIISPDDGATLMLKYNKQNDKQIKEWINSIGIRMLWSIPAALMEYILLDTASIGSYADLQFLDPAHHPSAAGELIKSMIFGNKVFQKKEDLFQQIDEMRTRFATRKGMMGAHRTLRSFNVANPMSREAYQALIIQDFPMNLNEQSIVDITTLIRDCHNIGFSTILAMPDNSSDYTDDKIKLHIHTLESCITVLHNESGNCFKTISECDSDSQRAAEIYFSDIPSEQRREKMRDEYYNAAKNALKVQINFNSLAPNETLRYSKSSASGLIIPLGLIQGGSTFNLRIDSIHIHTIISGVTGSGKTNLIHTLLLNTMLNYGPDEVEIYLIDFKHGADFSIYSNYHLPDMRVLSITNEVEFPLAVLEEVEAEYDRRAYVLGDSLNIDNHNRKHPDDRMKRILLIMDELYILVNEARNGEEKEILRIINKIAHDARSFGIHLVMCGQDIARIEGINPIINQCANRIVMHSSPDDVAALLDKSDVSEMVKQIGPSDRGTCVCSDDYSKTAKLAYIAETEECRNSILSSIDQHYINEKVPSNIRILLTEPSKSKYHPFSRFVKLGTLPDQEFLYFGEAMTLLKDFRYFPDESKNLWILGGESNLAELAGYSAMFYSLLSLLMIKFKKNAAGKPFDIFCIDGCDDCTGDIDRNNRFWNFCDELINQGELIDYAPGAESDRHIVKLTQMVEARKNAEETSYDPVWFIVSLADECYMTDSVQQAFRRLLDDGPKYGIHTILWTKDANWAQRIQLSTAPCDRLVLETGDLDIFGIKTKKNLASGYKAQFLGSRGAKLRLYDLPGLPWLKEILQRIKTLNLQ